jgi:tRNA threonylcarbamoyladenosine biosynthesis protein TsaB
MRNTPTTLLALDTSTRTVGLALYDGLQVRCELVWTSKDHHTIELAPAVADALNKCNISSNELGALGVALGPGSFTGLRIGLALAKGLAMVHRIPIVGIPTLDVLAYAQPVNEQSLAVVLHAGRGRLAVGWYQAVDKAWKSIRDVQVLSAEGLAQQIVTPTLVSGELSEEERHLLEQESANIILTSPASSVRRPAYLAEMAWKRWQSGKCDDPASLAPFYLHYNEPIPG